MGRLRGFFKKNPFLLAHHPSCDKFSHHTFSITDWRLCLGCFVIYPTAVISLIILYLGSQFYIYDYYWLFSAAIVFFCLNLLRKSLFRDEVRQSIHVISRMMLGISLALILVSIWLAPKPQNIIILTLLLTVAIGYNLLNGRKYLKTCKTCSQYDKFPRCEGLVAGIQKGENY